VTEAATPVSYKGWAGIKRAFGTPSALTMAMLGFGSGLPFLLIASQTLSTRLRDVGLDLGSIGLISLASFFYLLKFLWAPLLDRYAFPLLAARPPPLVAAGVAGAGAGRPGRAGLRAARTGRLAAGDVGAGGVVRRRHPGFAVDAYRIEIAPQTAQAALAATYTLGYRIGLILAGAGALYLAQFEGWIVAYLAMAALMLLPIVTTLLCAEPERPATAVQRRIDVAEAFVQPISSFFSRNGVALALVLLAFVGLFKFPTR
jgi:PAT family beta-lactamase induction signal transducer AmpG